MSSILKTKHSWSTLRFDLLIKSDREIWHSVTLFRLRLIIVCSLMSAVIIGRRNWFLGHLNWPQSTNSDIFRETCSIFCFITAEPRLTGHLQSVDNSRLGGHLKAGGHPFRELTHPVGWELPNCRQQWPPLLFLLFLHYIFY